MRFRTTLILGILALLLGAFYVVFDVIPRTRLLTTEERQQEGKKVFFGKEFRWGVATQEQRLRDLITRLVLQRGGEKVVLERTSPRPDEKWRMAEPLSVDASAGDVGRICYELETLAVKSALRPPEGQKLDLAPYGLDKPQASATFTVEKPGEAATTWTLLAGSTDASRKVLYVKRADQDTVWGVEPAILDRLRTSVNELRDPVVLTLNVDKVSALELQYAQPEAVIRCESRDKVWRVTQPVSDYADESKVKDVLSAVGRLRIKPENFITEDDSQPEKYGLKKPSIAVIVYQQGEARSLLLGAPVEGKSAVYAKLQQRPSIFALESKDVSQFNLKPDDLRTKSAMRFSVGDVEAIRLDLPAEKVAVLRKDDLWKIETPVAQEADPTEVQGFLSALEGLEVQAWGDEKEPDLAKYGLQIPVATLTLSLKGGTESALLVGKPEEGKFIYARRGEGGPVLKLKSDFMNKVTPGHLTFLERTVHLGEGTVKGLAVERPDGKFVCKLENDKWLLESPAKVPADEETMRTLTWNLSFLSAVRYIERAPKNLAQYGLDAPSIKVTLTSEKQDGEKKELLTKTLLVGKDTGEESRYAMLEGGELVFTLAKATVEPLEKSPASRTVCEFAKDKVLSVVIEEPGKLVRFERQNEVWRKKLPEEGEADAQAIEALLARMSRLVADSVAAYALDDPAKYGLDKPTAVVTANLAEKSYKVSLGNKKDDQSYYAAAGGPLVYLLKAADVAKLTLKKPAGKEPATEPPAGVPGTGEVAPKE